MKFFKSPLAFLTLLGLFLFTSCGDDENLDPIAAWTLSAPTLTSPAAGSVIALDPEFNEDLFAFTWQGATSSAGYGVNYQFMLATTADPAFENPFFIIETRELQVEIVAQEFDAALAAAGFENGGAAEILWSVKAISLDKETLAGANPISVVRFPDTGPVTTLHMLSDEGSAGTLVLSGGMYISSGFLALQQGVTYNLNTKANGTGTSYGVAIPVGTSVTPNGDNVTGNTAITEGSSFLAERDQMYKLTADLTAGTMAWQYYNIKLFHWDEDGGGWDARTESIMTYEHPYQFKRQAVLQSNFHSKFNSPWDNQFGADNPSQLIGTMTNNGGSNFDNITQAGLYQTRIVISPSYATGTYEFVKL